MTESLWLWAVHIFFFCLLLVLSLTNWKFLIENFLIECAVISRPYQFIPLLKKKRLKGHGKTISQVNCKLLIGFQTIISVFRSGGGMMFSYDAFIKFLIISSARDILLGGRIFFCSLFFFKFFDVVGFYTRTTYYWQDSLTDKEVRKFKTLWLRLKSNHTIESCITYTIYKRTPRCKREMRYA